MPKYTFVCSSCKHEFQSLVSVKVKELNCPQCSSLCTRNMPNIGDAQVSEIIDKKFGTKWKQDQKELVATRREDYYWSKMVSEHSLQTSLENGWVYFDEKGQLQVHTKPPGRR